MKVRGFVQSGDGDRSTVAELLRVHGWSASEIFVGCYAYATQSGAVAFDISFGQDFWNAVQTRWLFGLDYGRTQPLALRYIADRPNTEVRIYDGAWVVESVGFLPRRDFHMKTSFLLNQTASRFGMVTGSGNFSSNGLSNSVECGAALRAENENEFNRTILDAYQTASALWDNATPLADILERYELLWKQKSLNEQVDQEDEPSYEEVQIFWIEAGYVTRNRGHNHPGNQIDMPRGMNRFFGFNAPANLPVNSVIGSIRFDTPIGDAVSRNLRLGNNHMEKVSLPIPETHGFDMYDGKVLVFSPANGGFKMWALEVEDFDTAFAGRLAGVKIMASGRRYGYIKQA
ncbi:MAG: hypothetical protein WC889_08110 [Myxococcota bacterium]|jgi:hypothetical protein